jgi:hypothetical protein
MRFTARICSVSPDTAIGIAAIPNSQYAPGKQLIQMLQDRSVKPVRLFKAKAVRWIPAGGRRQGQQYL